MKKEILEKVKIYLQSNDEEMRNLGRNLFWQNSPTYSEFLEMEERTSSISENSFNNCMKLGGSSIFPMNLEEVKAEIKEIQRLKHKYVVMQFFSQAADLRDKEKRWMEYL